MKEKNKKIKLNLGSGVFLKKGYINVEKFCTLKDLQKKKGIFKNAIIEDGAEFVQADLLKLPFKDNFADYIVCIDVIEHMKIRHVIPVLKEMRRVMKKGATLNLLTIDFTKLCEFYLGLDEKCHKEKKLYLDGYADLAMAIFGNQVGEHDGEIHKVPFNDIFFSYCIKEAGFSEYTITKYTSGAQCDKTIEGWDWDGAVKYDMLLATVVK